MVASDPEAIAEFIGRHAPDAARIGLETGATSNWLWTELKKKELPIICIDSGMPGHRPRQDGYVTARPPSSFATSRRSPQP